MDYRIVEGNETDLRELLSFAAPGTDVSQSSQSPGSWVVQAEVDSRVVGAILVAPVFLGTMIMPVDGPDPETMLGMIDSQLAAGMVYYFLQPDRPEVDQFAEAIGLTKLQGIAVYARIVPPNAQPSGPEDGRG